MFRNVPVSKDLLAYANSTLDSGPGACLVFTGVFTFLGLALVLIRRIAGAEDMGREWRLMGAQLRRVIHSTLIPRLCMLHAMIVIPLIFYVNTKEHYMTSKQATMFFMAATGLGAWLAVRWFVPRFKVPFTWPIALVCIAGTLSMFAAVNIAEGIGDLLAIFGSAVFTFLGLQTFSTSKRIHLLAILFVIVGGIMSLYGLSQAYLLLPVDMVYAVDTRAPVSTIGNKNYAAYYLDLCIPLTIALAATRRGPFQTLLCLMVYFICRWHFVLCDTRGGTSAMTVGILLTTALLAIYHKRRFRMLLFIVLLEPIMWGTLNGGGLDYQDTQRWGKVLNYGPAKKAVHEAIPSLPKDLAELRPYLSQWFFQGNEAFLGVPMRIPATLLAIALALGVFYLLVKRLSDWRIHLGAACILAFLPYWFVAWGTMPARVPYQTQAGEIVRYFEQAKVPNQRLAVQMLQEYAAPMARGTDAYNDLYLSKHRDVAAKFSLSLFMCMAVFLLFRWHDRNEGWLPGMATVGCIAAWWLVYFMLNSGGHPLVRPTGGIFAPMTHAWPLGLEGIASASPLLGFIFSPFAFAVFSLAAILIVITWTQFLPDTQPEAVVARARALGWRTLQGSAIAVAIVLLLVFSLHKTTWRVAGAVASHIHEGPSRALFYGAHAFFNTQGEFSDVPADNPVGFRLEIYQGTLRKMEDNPIIGLGPGNFKVINPHPKYETALERRILGKEVLGRHPHNDFLEDATDSGALALLGMIWMFGATGFILFRALRLIHPPGNASDVFVNTMSWGLLWAMTSILVHAQFEMPLLQPSSTYPAWLLFGVCYQIWRIQRRRIRAVQTESPLVVESPSAVAERALRGAPKPSAAVYELPPVPSVNPLGLKPVPGFVSWPLLAVLVPILMGTVLMRQFVGEMWLRWGMIFSDTGERYDFVFNAMEKSQDIYPQEMETNYILGRYCIDAVSTLFRPWHMLMRPDIYTEAEREQAEKELARIEETNRLDRNKIVDYAQLGIDVHIRDVFMNPSYKWAHNNMGVLYDKLTSIYEALAVNEKDPEKRNELLAKSTECEARSRNCYSVALEIDDLQVYALYNLGQGALRDSKTASSAGNEQEAAKGLRLALQYFERTLLADPSRQDVNVFIAECRTSLRDYEGAVTAMERLFAWMDKRPTNRVDPYLEDKIEPVLIQCAQRTMESKGSDVAYRASTLLSERFEGARCRYLPLLAHAAVNSGSPTAALAVAATARTECANAGRDGKPVPLSAELVFAEAKAYTLVGNSTSALQSLRTLMRSGAAAVFRDSVLRDPAFESLRKAPDFQAILKEMETAKAIQRATPTRPNIRPPAPAGDTPQPSSAVAVHAPTTGPMHPHAPAVSGPLAPTEKTP
ncbi:MAG: hypothetical protein GHCLOJNM_00796 [bacterium]|nr:hypothetical protein [bacterium]